MVTYSCTHTNTHPLWLCDWLSVLKAPFLPLHIFSCSTPSLLSLSSLPSTLSLSLAGALPSGLSPGRRFCHLQGDRFSDTDSTQPWKSKKGWRDVVWVWHPVHLPPLPDDAPAWSWLDLRAAKAIPLPKQTKQNLLWACHCKKNVNIWIIIVNNNRQLSGSLPRARVPATILSSWSHFFLISTSKERNRLSISQRRKPKLRELM